MPSEIHDLVRLARTSVATVIGVEPDLTPETLPLVDQYLRQVKRDSPPDVQRLVIISVGCYFGEVLRRVLNGRWAQPRRAPESWRIELETCFLHFTPVGMAGEVLTGAETSAFDGSFDTSDDLRDGLTEMLSEAAPMSEEEYYSLAGRVDVLQLAADWLVGRALAADAEATDAHPDQDQEKRPPRRTYTAADYRRLLGEDEPC